MRNPRFDLLFEPLAIGPKTLKNRFYAVPHSTGFGTVRPGSQAKFRSMRAEGGWGAVCVEFCSVHPESDESPHVAASLWDDYDEWALRLAVDEIHQHGALAGLELWHGGSMGLAWGSRMVPAAPSQIAAHHPPFGVIYPRTLDEADIKEIQSWYADAARRAVQIGVDIVYVYGSFSYLPIQFLSTDFNQRTDGYGGSFSNRARFWFETMECVKKAVGNDAAVATRISLDAVGYGGVKLEESLKFIELADPFLDLWDVNIGSFYNTAEITPSRNAPTYYMREYTQHVKVHTRKPVVGVGRLTNPDLMVGIIRRGELDLIGGARPSIADPFLPKKIEEGREDDIRECIGCNLCLQRGAIGTGIACTQNATAGEEYRRAWHPEKFSRASNADSTVLVVGAGAAGLECTRVLGERGFEGIHLVDAAADVGGYAAMAASLPGLSEWRRLIDYRVYQIQKLPNVELIKNTRLNADEVLAYGANIVVMANGSHWAADGFNHVTRAPIEGHHLSHVFTPEGVLLRNAKIGERVLVYDCDGHIMGSGLAERFARAGHRVTLITPLAKIAQYTDQTLDSPDFRRTLRDLGIEMLTSVRLDEITESECRVSGRAAAGKRFEVDNVILVTSRVSDDSIYRELRSRQAELTSRGITALYAIGDCVAPRLIGECIFDGHRLAREIDSANPRWAIVPRREPAFVS
jgi:dimethylamine/trimethylamine dehydrogenase